MRFCARQEIIGILETLKQQKQITEPILRVSAIYQRFHLTHALIGTLQETRAGLAVGKLRSHASKAVADLAKEIVKKWKQLVELEKQQSKAGARESSVPAAGAAASGVSTAAGKPPGASYIPFAFINPLTLFVLLQLVTHTARKQSSASVTPTPTTPTATNSTPSLAGISKNDIRTAKSDGMKISHTGDGTRDKCTELIYDALAFDSGSRALSPTPWAPYSTV